MRDRYCYLYKLFILFFICNVFGEYIMESQEVTDELIPKLYALYKNAVENDVGFTSLRRYYKGNKENVVHVKKLKEVSGFKKHNLRISDKKIAKTSLVYINNPVEAKIPTAFLTIDEFKTILLNRVKNEREQFDNSKKTRLKVNKTTSKHRILIKKDKNMNVKLNNALIKPSPIQKVIFHDQYVNLTVEVKDTRNSLLENVPNTTENSGFLTTAQNNNTVDNTYETNKNIDIESSDDVITSTDSTVSSTDKPGILRAFNETRVTEMEITIEDTKLDDITKQNENTNAKITYIEDSTIVEDTTTITTTKKTKRTMGRPFVFLGGDAG